MYELCSSCNFSVSKNWSHHRHRRDGFREMLCFNFIFYYFVRFWRDSRKDRRRRRRRRRNDKDIKLKAVGRDVEKNKDVVDGDSSDEDDDHVVPVERSFIRSAIMLWSLLEILTLILSLIFMKEEHGQWGFKDNFMGDLCKERSKACRNILNRIIYYKLLVAVTLMIGAKYVS